MRKNNGTYELQNCQLIVFWTTWYRAFNQCFVFALFFLCYKMSERQLITGLATKLGFGDKQAVILYVFSNPTQYLHFLFYLFLEKQKSSPECWRTNNAAWRSRNWPRLSSASTWLPLTWVWSLTRCVSLLCFALYQNFLSLLQDVAHTLSGLRKSAYNNNLNCIQKLLGIDKPLNVSDVCVQAGCSGIKDIAQSFLKKYIEQGAAGALQDFSHPQYPACAVYTVCKYLHTSSN